MITLTWTDKHGAGRMRHFQTSTEAAAYMSKLRCEATARCGERIVGQINRIDKGDSSDGRHKWAWHIESGIGEAARDRRQPC